MTNPRTRVAIPATLTFAIALSWGVAAQAYYAGGGKDADKGNDCLIGYNGIDQSDVTVDGKKQSVECTDCDPTCDFDGDPTANNSCTLKIGVCLNQATEDPACVRPNGLDKATAKYKAKGKGGVKGELSFEDPSKLLSSACGAFVPLTDLLVTLKEKKDGTFKSNSATFNLSGLVDKDKEADTPKRKDKDKLTYVCLPRPAGEPCPEPTTTSTTTSTTSSTIKPCGNGTVNNGEQCDFNANPTGCSAGDTCIPDCTCATGCVPPSAGETALTFTTGIGTTQCGSPGFFPTVATSPFGGTLDAKSCTCATAADCVLPGTCVQGHCTAGAANRIACTGNTDCAAGQTCEPYSIDLGLGCLYIGGGNSTVPGGNTPNDAPNTFAVDLVCDGGDTLALGGAATGNPKTCTVEDGPTKYCANGNPGIGGTGACNSDADCRPNCAGIVCHDGGPNDGQPCDPTDTAFCATGQCYGDCVNGAPGRPSDGHCAAGSQCGSGSEGCIDPNPDPPDECEGVDGLVCVPTANCYFGPPLPVRNDALSTCVLNVFDNDAFGVAHKAAGEVTVGYTLSSRVYFTSRSYTPGSGPVQPCPVCVDGTCNFGPNQGQPCVGVGVDGTTHDCPPDGYFFLAPLSVTLDPLTTNTASQPPDGAPSDDGIFCPFQGNAGAFKVPAGRLITMLGVPVAGGLDNTAKPATLVSAFCIPKTGSVVIDGAANLPGPGATSLGGTLQLQ